jgi:hypothetical protein
MKEISLGSFIKECSGDGDDDIMNEDELDA